MLCKLNQVIDFVRQYKLLDDLDDAALTETFNIFPHCCSWDKGLGFAELDDSRLDLAVDKIMEVLDESYDHNYTAPQIKEIATSFMKVFEAAGAPKSPVPFVIVMLARI
ncbi:MAG: hypothetical protein AB7U44_01550 [Sulfuricurvum sp.]|uniref:hypothetical protein n=1 Tax=Sulfuricurvum sp. TaxID=2025608 RepID=UPI0026062C08|nr:hypothetical protein [Sulfuricurvum sp.]MDD3595497.1 hypothetical protein [Sulfuricurvum sp.]MDD4884177.1 hypothetical protein [Sulfuricurvum sp.]